MENISPAAAIYAGIVCMLFLLFYISGKKKFMQYCKALDKKEYPLKDFTVVGFSLMGFIKYPYNTVLDRKLRKQLRELKEEEYIEFYLRATWATAATYFMLMFFLSGLLALTNIGIMPVAMMVAFGLLMGYSVILDVDKKIEGRHNTIIIDIPDFTNKLLILSGAGLTLQGAMVKVSKEMHKDTPFYQELKHSIYLMENGATVEQAMDSLNNRCNLPEVRRMTSVLLQNIHSAGPDVLIALREISRELWNNRRAAAKVAAEKAGTTLLFPMMLMLLAVILIVAAPAVMSLSL